MEYGNVERRLALLRDEIEELDGKCDIGLLSNEEVEMRKVKFEELWKLWKSKEAFYFSKDLDPNGLKREMKIRSSSMVV